MSQVDAFPEIPSKKKPKKITVPALEKVRQKLGSFGYLEDCQNPHFSYTQKNWVAVGTCGKEFPYKKTELARGATVDEALSKVGTSL